MGKLTWDDSTDLEKLFETIDNMTDEEIEELGKATE